jgi:hypothetical protein
VAHSPVTHSDDQVGRVLREVAQGDASSHRAISAASGLSLGLTNQVLRALVRRRIVRMVRLSTNRWAYWLTPRGEGERERIARDELAAAAGAYAVAREQIRGRLVEIARRLAGDGRLRVVIVGCDDVAEIACRAAQDTDLEVVGVVGGQGTSLFGLPVYPFSSLSGGELGGRRYDRVIVAALGECPALREQLQAAGVPLENVSWL